MEWTRRFPAVMRGLTVGRTLALGLALALPLGLAACQTPEVTPPPAAEQTPDVPIDSLPPAVDYEALQDPVPGTALDPSALMRVALLVPLSGDAADTGQALLNAAQMALFDNADDRLVLQPYDTRGTADGAREAASLALAQGSRLIIGPLFSASAQAAAPQARAAGVNMITFSTDTSVAGDGVYVVGFLLREQVRRVVEHARANGLQRFAALAPDGQYGRLMVEAYRDAVQRMGGEMGPVEFYNPANPQDLATVIRRLGDFETRAADLTRQRAELEARGDAAAREALRRLEGRQTAGNPPFDALLLPEGAARAREVAAMLAHHEIDPGQIRLLGPMLWNDPAMGREPAMVGAWYPAPPPDTHGEFETRYQRTFGSVPPVIAGLAYDTTALAAILARQGGPAPFGQDALTNPSGFAGYDGLFRFRLDGTSERGFAVMEVRPEGATLVGQAPRTFDPAPLPGPDYIEGPRPAF